MSGPSLHDRVFRAVLKLFPREFRGDFGEQMADDFRDQREHAANRRQRARLLTRTVAGALRRAPAEHFDVLRRDAGYALRLFRRNPGFAAAVVLTLAIGVGSTTAVFTLADPMLFRPLPYPESDRIVEFLARSNGEGTFMHLPDFFQAEASSGAFEAVAQFGPGPGIGRIEGLEKEPFAYEVTQRFFDVVRVRPFIGREFLPEEYRVNATGDAAILTFGFWQKAFGARPDILDQSLVLRGREPRRLRIVGVLPGEFVLPDDVNRAPDLLVATVPAATSQGNPNRLAWPIARVAPGVTMEAAALELQAIFRETERQFPQFVQGREARVRSLREGLFGSARTPLLMLLGATGCVLLLACTNLAHLFMARLQSRQREFGVRLAIGAGRGRLMRMLVMEAALFAVAGGAGALLFAFWTFDMVMARLPEFGHIYRLLPSRMDLRVTAFAASLVALALLIFGALPAFRASRLDVRGSLLNGGTTTPAHRRLTSDRTLIFVQSGVAIALMVTAALFVRSFTALAYQPLGFEPDAVRTIGLELTVEPRPGTTPAQIVNEQRRVYEHLQARLPVPITLASGWPAMTLPGPVSLPGAPKDGLKATAYPAAATLFDVFGIQLVSGRLYDEREAFTDAAVAVVDRRAASAFWPGQDPLGREVIDWTGSSRRVVGMVETLRTHLTIDNDGGAAFIPLISNRTRSLSMALRDPDGRVSLEHLRAAVQEVAPGARVGIHPFRPFERTLGQPRFLALLLGTLGLLAIALTIIGIFGVINHVVARRTREVGIRMACGADGAGIRRLIVRRALGPALLGIVAGIGLSLWWTPTLRSLLMGLEPDDPLTFALAGAIVLVTVLSATALPAWRASRVDPVVVLRAE